MESAEIKMYKTMILYECVCLTARQELRLKGFENRMLRKIFGLKTVEALE
jgi:hypothetical protein